MSLQPHDLARKVDGQWILRPGAMRVRWELGDLVAADGHRVRGSFVAGVRAIDDPTERKMLEEAFGGPVVLSEHLVEHFKEPLRAAAGAIAGELDAAQWLEAGGRQRLCDALLASARKVAFACGLEIVAPCEVHLESATLESQRFEDLQRTLGEKRATSHADQLKRSTELLRQFRALRESAPELSPGQILEQLPGADRSSFLQTLLLGASNESAARPFVAVGGDQAVEILATDAKPSVSVGLLPADLGPLRSVQAVQIDSQLVRLYGAQQGVLMVSSDGTTTLLRDAGVGSPRGFSKAIWWRGKVWACHGDGGIAAWDVHSPASPAFVLRPGGTMLDPKHLEALDDDRLIFASDAGVTTLDASGGVHELAAGGEILAILRAGARCVVVYADGGVRIITPVEVLQKTIRGPALSAAALLPWLGDVRLLLAEADGGVRCVGLDDTLVSEYASMHRGFRMLAGSATSVAGVTADRQRVVLWHAWDGRKSAAEVNLAALTRHRVADLESG